MRWPLSPLSPTLPHQVVQLLRKARRLGAVGPGFRLAKTDPFAPGVAKEAAGKASGIGSLLRMMKRITALEVQPRYRAMARPPVTMKCPAMPRKVKIGRRLDCLPSAAPASGPRPPELEDP